MHASVHACTGMSTCSYLNVWVFCKYRMKEGLCHLCVCAYAHVAPGLQPSLCAGSAVREGGQSHLCWASVDVGRKPLGSDLGVGEGLAGWRLWSGLACQDGTRGSQIIVLRSISHF